MASDQAKNMAPSPGPEAHVAATELLTRRHGERPATTPQAPHTQLDQNGPVEAQAALKARVFALPQVEERQTVPSDPRARAIWLKQASPMGPSTAFLGNREIGHFHPWDGSMHIALPPDVAVAAIEAGWGRAASDGQGRPSAWQRGHALQPS
jgi:phospholipase/carboxylesterase